MSRHFRLLVALCLLLCACGGPFLAVPGGALRGEVVAEPVEDWSAVATPFVDLEVRPDDPYSVELNYFIRGGQLYIDPAEGRAWLDHLRTDPRARVRFGERIYPVTAVLVARPGEGGFEDLDPTRFIYRLDSR